MSETTIGDLALSDDRLERLLAGADAGPGGCWLWRRTKSHGWPKTSVHYKAYRADRLIYTLFVGPIPSGMTLAHSCSDRRCVAPAHMTLAPSVHWCDGTLEERFWLRVEKTDGCWLWTGTRSARLGQRWGYGRIYDQGRMHYAHRLSYEIHLGPVPEGMVVCHRCDEPRCVRPDHLFAGTQKDNVADMRAKGRAGDSATKHWHAAAQQLIARHRSEFDEIFDTLKEQG